MITSGGSSVLHNDLSGLNVDDYQHLTEANHNLLVGTVSDCDIHRHLSIVDSTGNNSIYSNDADIGFFDADIGFFVVVDGNTLGRFTNGFIYGDELSFDYITGGQKFYYDAVLSSMRGGDITNANWDASMRGSNSFLWGLNGYAKGDDSFAHGINARAYHVGEYSHGTSFNTSLSRLGFGLSSSAGISVDQDVDYDHYPNNNMTLLVDMKVLAEDTTNGFTKYYRTQAVLKKIGTSFVAIGNPKTDIITNTAPVNQNWGLVLSGTNNGLNLSVHGDSTSGTMVWEIMCEVVVKIN